MSDAETVLVCVTDQTSCGRLIRYGRQRADETGSLLRVLHVRTREKTMMGNPDITSALNDLYSQAREAEAEMEIVSSQDVEGTIADYARKCHASLVVLGETPRDRFPPMADRLSPRLPGVPMEVVK